MPKTSSLLTRRRLLAGGATLLGASVLPTLPARQAGLPQSKTFIGQERFRQVVSKALRENWRDLAMGERVMRFAYEFHGVPYKSYTLEIDDRVEAPSVNLHGLDCWTFFEVALGLARMIEFPRPSYAPADLLREIEWTRYRGGRCAGNYLERIHYLAEWYFENEARGNITDLTRELGGAERIRGRQIREMTVLYKHYRYLRENPSLRPGMKAQEAMVQGLPVYHIPRSMVARIESKLRNGDVLGIVTKHHGGFCSHVGLATRTKDGVMRIMHASSNSKKVIVDKSISGYLNHYSSHLGLLVGRPLPRSSAITDPAEYQKRLRKLKSA